MDRDACADRRARKAAGIAQRVQVAAAPVNEAADIAVRSGHFAQARAVEQRDRHAALLALLDEAFDVLRAARLIGDAQRAVLTGLAGNLVAADQIEREGRRAVGKREHAPAEISAELFLDFVGRELEARIHLAAVVA